MKKFEIEIEEILQRVVTEEAETLEEALDKVYDKYHAQEIVLGGEDFKGEEIRAFGESKEVELRKDCTFNINIGQAILLEGNEQLGIIKKLSNNEEMENYIVVSGLKYNSQKDYFEWNQGKYFKNILAAVEYYDQYQENKIEKDYIKTMGDLPNNVKIGMYDMMIDEIFSINNYSEAVYKLKDYGLSNEEICCITSMDEDELNNILEDYEENEEEENEF